MVTGNGKAVANGETRTHKNEAHPKMRLASLCEGCLPIVLHPVMLFTDCCSQELSAFHTAVCALGTSGTPLTSNRAPKLIDDAKIVLSSDISKFLF